MTEAPRRPILRLKTAVTVPIPGAPKPSAAADDAPASGGSFTWKCKPCGKGFNPPAEGPDDEQVRCPACNARLGAAGDFRSDPPRSQRVRARQVG